jgi:uncharacterized protein (TIGR00251 family)
VTISLTRTAAGVTLRVRVVPRAGRTGVAGTRDDALLVRLAAAPVDGAANDALVAFLAELFDRPRRDITLVSGHTSRDKRIAIAGLSEAAIAAQLEALLRTRTP